MTGGKAKSVQSLIDTAVMKAALGRLSGHWARLSSVRRLSAASGP